MQFEPTLNAAIGMQCPSGQTGTAVFFDVPGGQTLYIDVDGATTGSGPAQGAFRLEWAMQ